MFRNSLYYFLFIISVFFISNIRGNDKAIQKAVKKYAQETIEYRHQIHQFPELSNREFKTAELVEEHLNSLGMEVKTGIAHTGVIGILKGRKPGPVVAVRADMDALPVTEDTDFSFKSTVRTNYLGNDVGVMHACGHDVHTAVQLGVASVLNSIKEILPGTVKFIFQPAEEGPPPGEEGGAMLMIKQNTMDNPRPVAIFGLHTLANLESGTIGYSSGPAFAAVDQFIIKIKGRQAHGASPEKSIDPIVMASEVVSALQTIRSRSLNPREPSVVTVGIIRGGNRFNIIPAEVYLEGTVRTYSKKAQDTVENRMHAILSGVTSAYGGSYNLNYKKWIPATINNPMLTSQVVPSLERAIGTDNVFQIPPTMGGEDFSLFANIVPGFYYRLGMVKPGTISGDHHTPTFRADDSCIPIGMKAMSILILDFLIAGGIK
ncbi:MAG: N-acyl-L-amino acid amidohydrolase [Candidatus Marinimicrobia bacterium]|nr:N-acyl-L-amino acid amidohydrolase [Candidatus Neomarinimicrobiota bacterium]|tara:strand:+ start:14400 stop:15695 length:1296 start_codon:yes stop_codon:yes gene_type:complete